MGPGGSLNLQWGLMGTVQLKALDASGCTFQAALSLLILETGHLGRSLLLQPRQWEHCSFHKGHANGSPGVSRKLPVLCSLRCLVLEPCLWLVLSTPSCNLCLLLHSVKQWPALVMEMLQGGFGQVSCHTIPDRLLPHCLLMSCCRPNEGTAGAPPAKKSRAEAAPMVGHASFVPCQAALKLWCMYLQV